MMLDLVLLTGQAMDESQAINEAAKEHKIILALIVLQKYMMSVYLNDAKVAAHAEAFRAKIESSYRNSGIMYYGLGS